METTVKTQKDGTVKSVTVVDETVRKTAEHQALTALAGRVHLKGFRPGKAPASMVREQIDSSALLEETVRIILPEILRSAMEQAKVEPILKPQISVESVSPLTVACIFTPRPKVSLKKPDKIAVEKKEAKDPTSEEVEAFIKQLLEPEKAELTAEYLKERLKIEKTPEEFRSDVKTMLKSQREREEMKRREEELYKLVRAAVQMEIPKTLLDAEIEGMVLDFEERLKEQRSSIGEWLRQTKKTPEKFMEELKSMASDRITLRFGMQTLAEHKEIKPTTEEVRRHIEEAHRGHDHSHADHDHHHEGEEPGGQIFESVRFEITMQKLMESMIR